MRVNKIFALLLTWIGTLFFCCSASTMSSEIGDKPEFVMAVIASYRSRADLLEKAATQNIRAYVLNAESEIDLENNCARNVLERAQGNWVRIDEAPLPDVVYDFGVNKNNRERKNKVLIMKDRLHSREIPFINSEQAMIPVNDKILFAKLMSKNNIRHPKTRVFTEKNLKKMLSSYDLLYIKPTKGSKGYAILIVDKVSNQPKLYRFRYKIKFRGVWADVNSEVMKRKQLYKEMREAQKHLNRDRAPYLIQEGIKFSTFKDKATDFRINIHRGVDGKVEVVGLSVRINGNISQNGRPSDFHSVMSEIQQGNQEAVAVAKQQILDMAFATHQALEEHGKAQIGDLGLDIVYKDGPVIIEANNKSGFIGTNLTKAPEKETLFGLPPFAPLGAQIDENRINSLIGYSRYLLAKNRI